MPAGRAKAAQRKRREREAAERLQAEQQGIEMERENKRMAVAIDENVPPATAAGGVAGDGTDLAPARGRAGAGRRPCRPPLRDVHMNEEGATGPAAAAHDGDGGQAAVGQRPAAERQRRNSVTDRRHRCDYCTAQM